MYVSFDWQALAVALIVLTALVYAGRRAFARLRSFTSRGRAGVTDCATGCGKCGDEVKDSKPANARESFERLHFG